MHRMQRRYTQRCINPTELKTLADFYNALEEYQFCTEHCLIILRKSDCALAKSTTAYFFHHQRLSDFLSKYPHLQHKTVKELISNHPREAEKLYHEYLYLDKKYTVDVHTSIINVFTQVLRTRSDELKHHQQEILRHQEKKQKELL